MSVPLMPTYFIPHGGGPWPVVPEFAEGHAELATFLRSLVQDIGATPTAILIISAHWEESVPTVSSRLDFSMLYDYGGFPAQAYRIQYPAPGSPHTAARVVELAHAAGLEVATESQRGYDHGVFVPLMVAIPDANIPVVPLSLIRGLDPAAHIELGRALAPLRREGVLIIGSGMSMHNLNALFGKADLTRSARFDSWLNDTLTGDIDLRNARLNAWASAPEARFSHPREEHLLPLMVAAGAADGDTAHRIFADQLFGAPISSFRFGDPIAPRPSDMQRNTFQPQVVNV